MPVRYAYLGPEGTFTEAALAQFEPAALPGGAALREHPGHAGRRAGRGGRARDRADRELGGRGGHRHPRRARRRARLAIRAELLLPVTFALLAQAGHGAGGRQDGRRPPAGAAAVPALAGAAPARRASGGPRSSNAEAARQAADGQIDAALAGAFAAELYGLAVLAGEVNDGAGRGHPVRGGQPPGPLPAATGADRTSLVAFLREDHPGALMELLTEFAVRGINLTRIESRPTGDGLGKYCFSIDCEGHLDDARVGEALMGLRRVCADVRFLGSYPRRDGGRAQVRPGPPTPSSPRRRPGSGGCATAGLGPSGIRPRRARCRRSQVRARGPGRRRALLGGPGDDAGRQRPAHLLELRPGGHLLGEQGGLDAVEQALQPADQLGLGDPQLGLARRVVLGERQREPLELLDQFGGQPLSSSLIELWWISPSRARLFSSSGAARTSSRSWRIMLPIRITLAGCSTIR